MRPFWNNRDGLDRELPFLFENGEPITKNNPITEIVNEYHISI